MMKQTFDSEAMLERLMGDQDLATRVVEGFLEDIPQQMCNLARALAAGDTDGAEREAHSLRGAAGVLSADRFSETAEMIELEARSGKVSVAAGYVPELQQRLEELTSALGSRHFRSVKA